MEIFDDLFIQIRDGMPYQHPIFGDNLRAAFPGIDTDNLPEGFARFIRREAEVSAGPYEVLVEEYVWNGAVVEDNWHIRPMTEQEIADTRNQAIARVEADRTYWINWANEQMANATDTDKPVWATYIEELTNVTYNDPMNVIFPRPPAMNEDGSILSLDAPGAAPDVTG
jgi:hypothetical protein